MHVNRVIGFVMVPYALWDLCSALCSECGSEAACGAFAPGQLEGALAVSTAVCSCSVVRAGDFPLLLPSKPRAKGIPGRDGTLRCPAVGFMPASPGRTLAASWISPQGPMALACSAGSFQWPRCFSREAGHQGACPCVQHWSWWRSRNLLLWVGRQVGAQQRCVEPTLGLRPRHLRSPDPEGTRVEQRSRSSCVLGSGDHHIQVCLGPSPHPGDPSVLASRVVSHPAQGAGRPHSPRDLSLPG